MPLSNSTGIFLLKCNKYQYSSFLGQFIFKDLHPQVCDICSCGAIGGAEKGLIWLVHTYLGLILSSDRVLSLL